jgi:hypothetical protein
MLETTIISSHKCNLEILVLEQTISFRINVEFILLHFFLLASFIISNMNIIGEKLHFKNTYAFLMPQNSTLTPNNLSTLKLHIGFHIILL